MGQLFRGEAGREGRVKSGLEGRVVIFQGNVYVRHLGNGIDSEPEREREREREMIFLPPREFIFFKAHIIKSSERLIK